MNISILFWVLSIILGLVIVFFTRLYLYKRDDKDRKLFSNEAMGEFKRKNPKILAISSFAIYLFILLLGVFVWKNDAYMTLKNAIVFLWLVPVGLIDYKEQIIPNILVVCGLIFWVIYLIISVFILKNTELFDILKVSFYGMLLGAGVFLIPAIITKNAVGMGDVKLFGVLGLIYGFSLTGTNVFTIIFLTIIIISVAGIILMCMKKANKKSTLPVAPYLLIAFTFSSLVGLLQ